jgi:hypothetical protein
VLPSAAVADWTCPNCSWANRDFVDKCLSCGAPRPTGADAASARTTLPTRRYEAGRWDLAPPAPKPVDPNAAPDFVLGPIQEMPEVATRRTWFTSEGLGRGILFAAVAAVVASALWYAVVALSQYQIAFIAIAVGWVTGTAAVVGARGRGSIPLSIVSALLTLAALFVSEYLINYHYMTQFFGPVGLLQPPDVVFAIVAESLSADPTTLLFWALALGAAVWIPFKAIAFEGSRPPSLAGTPNADSTLR